MISSYSTGQGHRLLRSQLNRAGLVVLLLLLTQNLLRLPLMVMQRVNLFGGFGMSSQFTTQLASFVIYLVSMGLTLVVGLYLMECDGQFAFPMTPVRHDYFVPGLLLGLGAAMVSNLFTMILTVVLQDFGIYSRASTPYFGGGVFATLFTFAGMTLLPALCEELLFRGLLLQPLRRYGDRVAVVVSSLLFALCHSTLPQAVNAFIVGLCLGVFAVRTGSLVLSMWVHFSYNSIACVITLLGQRLPMAGAAASWLVLALVLVAALFAAIVIKRKFGTVWLLGDSRQEHRPWTSAVTSIPLVIAVLLCLAAIVRNLYYLPTGGLFP